jgi:hypothetical protein
MVSWIEYCLICRQHTALQPMVLRHAKIDLSICSAAEPTHIQVVGSEGTVLIVPAVWAILRGHWHMSIT